MTKKHFIALADTIARHNQLAPKQHAFTLGAIEALAEFCQKQNPNVNRERWVGYIRGTNGPNGGIRK